MAEANPSMTRPVTPPLPTGTLVPQHQVAGHAFGKGKTKLGMPWVLFARLLCICEIMYIVKVCVDD